MGHFIPCLIFCLGLQQRDHLDYTLTALRATKLPGGRFLHPAKRLYGKISGGISLAIEDIEDIYEWIIPKTKSV